jgi:DNA repair protein RadC
MRVTKYKTKLTTDRKAVLEKDYSVNYPELDNMMNSPEKIVKLAKGFLRMHEETEEYMYMICLNTKLMMTGLFEISHGNVNSSVVGTREVFQKALLGNAVSIILMHNHPSGDCTPSIQDIEVTKRLVEAGKIIGVEVLDHIIIGKHYCSLREKGHL